MKAVYSNNVNATRNKLYSVIPLDTPYSMFIDVCNACNFKCEFCAIQYTKKNLPFRKKCMSLENFKKVIDDMQNFSSPLKMMRLYGNGEPLINKELPEMIQYAKDQGVTEWIEIVTNASLLSPDVNRRLVDSGLNRIRISIEGIGADAYKQMSNANIDWSSFIANIRNLYENKKDCEIYIKTVDAAVDNPKTKEEFFETFGDICDKIFIENIAPLWAGYEEIKSDFNITKVSGLNGSAVRNVKVCPFPFYSCMINPDGEVTACCADWERKIIYGNAFEENICEIWNGRKHKQFLKGMLNGRNSYPNICAKCEYPCYNATDNLDEYVDIIKESIE